MSRRDMIRASAVVAAASAAGIRGVNASPTRDMSATSRWQDEGPATDVELHLSFNPYGEDVTLDPHLAPNWGPFWVMLPYAWSGLLRFDENGAVEPDLAESVEPNEDGTVWTAILKEGIAFGDGTPVEAQHFIDSWKMALSPHQLAPMARFMSPVQGYTEFTSGDSQDIGFRAVDDRTIEITLAEPLGHFRSWLATFVWAVINPAYLNQLDTPSGLETAGAGPWRIVQEDGTRIVMEPNEHYWAEHSPSITSIVWDIAPGGATDQSILDAYVSGPLAFADVPATLLETVTNDPALAEELVTIEDHASTLAISLDFHQEPFNDVRVRRAIAHAIDREAWAEEIMAGEFVPATSFTPPVLATIANYQAPEGPTFDPAAASSLIDEAGLDPESQQEIIHFQPATDTPEAMSQREQLLQMINENTGLDVGHNTNLTREQITALRQDNGGLQFDVVQWWLDSDTPSILEIAAQDSEYNAGWVNWEPDLEASGDATPGEDAAAYNELIMQARATLDEAERNELYAQAETLLLENAVYIPLGYWVQRFLQKPWIQGTRQGPWSGSTPVRIDENVVVLGNAGTPASE